MKNDLKMSNSTVNANFIFTHFQNAESLNSFDTILYLPQDRRNYKAFSK